MQFFLHTYHPSQDKLGSIPTIIKRCGQIQIFGYRVKVKIAAAPSTRRRRCSRFQRRASAGLKGQTGQTKIIRAGGGRTAQCDRVVAQLLLNMDVHLLGASGSGGRRKWCRTLLMDKLLVV